jgi:16S rRNA (uracil1498-N3)-methyltransferase
MRRSTLKNAGYLKKSARSWNSRQNNTNTKRMTRLYLSSEPVNGKFLLGRDYRKRLVKVMRLKTGDQLEIGSLGKRYICRIEAIQPDEIALHVVRELPVPAPGLKITLAQAMMKGDRFEWLIQKATELGVTEIYPLITERTVVRPAHAEEKLQRWNEIAEEAAGQSENPAPALVQAPQTLSSFLMLSWPAGLKLQLHEREGSKSLKPLLKSYDGDHIIFIVGPEGGWTDRESLQLETAGFLRIHLGPRILRAETAGLVLASLLQYELGDFQSADHALSKSDVSSTA